MEFNEQELTDFKYTIEAALLASTEPLSVSDIKRMFNEDLNANLIKDMLRQIAEEWSSRSGEVVEVASGWRIQVRTNFQARLDKLEHSDLQNTLELFSKPWQLSLISNQSPEGTLKMCVGLPSRQIFLGHLRPEDGSIKLV